MLQGIWDFLGIPFRFLLLDQKWLPKLGWTTLEEERIRMALPHIKGELLDIGAGPNTLAKAYGRGVGVDVVEWGGGAMVVEDTSNLPFADSSFDTVSFIACLNHIPYREAALREAGRVLKPGGRIIITMINPFVGGVGHTLWWYSEDKHRGGMKEGEVGGMWNREIVQLCEDQGFKLLFHTRFQLGLNNLYVFQHGVCGVNS
jgi:SAM-dependent methyltransferase